MAHIPVSSLRTLAFNEVERFVHQHGFFFVRAHRHVQIPQGPERLHTYPVFNRYAHEAYVGEPAILECVDHQVSMLFGGELKMVSERQKRTRKQATDVFRGRAMSPEDLDLYAKNRYLTGPQPRKQWHTQRTKTRRTQQSR
jgi:hypothetical protein